MNREMFDLYVTTQLVPTLRKGDVVILDNLSSHKSPCAANALRKVGVMSDNHHGRCRQPPCPVGLDGRRACPSGGQPHRPD
jgi:hypothetical protein